MTVAELIEELRQLDHSKEIWGYNHQYRKAWPIIRKEHALREVDIAKYKVAFDEDKCWWWDEIENVSEDKIAETKSVVMIGR